MSSFVKIFLDGMFSNIKGLRGIGKGNLTYDRPSSKRDVDAGADRAGVRRRSSIQISTISDFLEEYVFVILKNLIVGGRCANTGTHGRIPNRNRPRRPVAVKRLRRSLSFASAPSG
jgi:hypothetical protein